MTSNRIDSAVRQQFGKQAAYYVRSQVHMSGDTLDILVDWAQPRATDRALDVATGVGFTGFAFAPHAGQVVAYDLTHEMLREAIGIAGQRGLANVRFVQGPAEHLPFANDTFDIYTCRTAPHHFFSVPDFLAEACRVLKPGGQFLMADTVTVEDPEVDAWQNRIELLRDPSHVRDYAPSEWLRFIGQAGLSTLRADLALHTHLTFNDWVERSGTPPAVVDELRAAYLNPPNAVARAFAIEPQDGDIAFAWPVLTVQAVKP